MATRQRARPSTSKTSSPIVGIQAAVPSRGRQGAPAPSDLPNPAAEVPEVAAPATAATEVTFLGEQLSYKSRYERIAESAYGYAQARGFVPGGEIDDWLRAEREVDALLAGLDTDENRAD